MRVERKKLRLIQSGFSLVEVMVAVAILGVTMLSLYAAFSSGFATLQAARENLRATQIMVEKLEIIRLYKWDDVGTIPLQFQEPYAFNTPHGGFVYFGTVTIEPAPYSESYSSDLRRVTMRLNWRSGAATRNREMTTLISRHGLQRYIY